MNSGSKIGLTKNRNRRLLTATLTSLLGKVVGMATMIVTTPMILHSLDLERFGLWMTLSSLAIVFAFLDFGIGNGLVSIVSQANGADDRNVARQAVTSASLLLATIVGLILAAFFAVVDNIAWQSVLKTSAAAVTSEAVIALKIAVSCLAVNLLLQFAQKVQIAYQESYQANIWQMASSCVSFFSLVLAVQSGGSLTDLIVVVSVIPVVFSAINCIHQFLIVRPWLLPNRASLNWGTSKRVITLGALWAFSQIAGFVGTGADNLLITAYLGPTAVGPYAVMSRLQSVLLISQLLALPLWPAFAEALQRGDKEWARAAFRKSVAVFLMLGLFSALVLAVGSFYIIPLWVGMEMVPTMELALGFACWAIITNFFSAVSALLACQGTLRQLTSLTTVAALLSLTVKLLTIEGYGVAAVIWASVIGYSIICIPAIYLSRELLKDGATEKIGLR